MRRHSKCIAVLLLGGAIALVRVGAASAAEAMAATTGGAGSEFNAFCASWMDKLIARQQHNQQHINWQPNQSGVEGQYVGYGRMRACETTIRSGVPVGHVVYYEYRYRKQGASTDTAAGSRPEIVDTTEVTEIFRYANGKWVY